MPIFDSLIFDASIFDTGLVGITQPPASFQGAQARTPTTATGNPTYPWNLFRGQAIRPQVQRIGDILKVTVTLSDYNRLWPLMKVGAPIPGNNYLQPDGSVIAIDANALNYGIGPGDSGVFKYHVTNYWPISPYAPFPDLVDFVNDTNPDYSGLPVIDWTTALSDSKAFLDDFAGRQSAATKYWIDADHKMHWTTVGPSEFEVDLRVPAPFEIDQDGPIQDGNVIQAMSLDAVPDHSQLYRRIFIRGGTPLSSGWYYNDGAYYPPIVAAPTDGGEAYVDAPGAVTADDAAAIAAWWFKWNYRTLITGSTHIPGQGPLYGGQGEDGHDGWRVGQSIVLSDEVLSRYVGLPLDRYEAIITGVSGKLVGTGGLFVSIDGDILSVDISARVTSWQSFSFSEVGFGEVGQANVTIEISDPDEVLEIRPLSDWRIFTDGSANIEYDIAWGDIPGGALSRQLARIQARPEDIFTVIPPAYKILFSAQKLILPDTASTVIVGQLADQTDTPVALPGVFVEVELLQWSDMLETIVGSGFTWRSSGTDISSFTTNVAGQFYDIIDRNGGDAVVAEPKGQALPL